MIRQLCVANKWLNETTKAVGDIKHHLTEQTHLLTRPSLYADLTFQLTEGLFSIRWL